MTGVVAGESVGALMSRGQARAEGKDEGATVLVTHHTVQQEVAAGVHRGEEVEDVAQAEHDGARGTVLVGVVEDVDDQHDGGWGLADDEQYHDCYQCCRDLVLLSLAAAVRAVSWLYLLQPTQTR